MQHSKRTDSFGLEDEHFFQSYVAEPISAEGSQPLEFDSFDTQPPTAEQLAHFSRFRKPVAWVVAAMGGLSLVALGQGFQQHARRAVAAHVGSSTAIPAARRTSEAPGSCTEFPEGRLALVLAPPSISGGQLAARADATTRTSLVNDFTSALLSMCRDSPA